METTSTTTESEMTQQVRLYVRGCTVEQYAEVARRIFFNNNGIEGRVVRVTKTARGATVTVAA